MPREALLLALFEDLRRPLGPSVGAGHAEQLVAVALDLGDLADALRHELEAHPLLPRDVDRNRDVDRLLDRKLSEAANAVAGRDLSRALDRAADRGGARSERLLGRPPSGLGRELARNAASRTLAGGGLRDLGAAFGRF